MENFSVAKIEQNKVQFIEESTEAEYTPTIASTAMELGALAMKFARVERVPRYDEESRENDAEHSFMLSLVGTELAVQLYPGKLNLGLITQYAMVHDLIEVKTGDVATFHHSAEDMAAKQLVEHAALEDLLKELPPYTAWLLSEYEQQVRPEARFVKAVDKLLPVIVDILGPGKKVMEEDYNVTTSDQLQKSHDKLHGRIAKSFSEFPSIVDAHEQLCELFALEFEVTPQSS